VTKLPSPIDRIPRAVPLPRAASGKRRMPSLVWLVPIAALIIGVILAGRAMWRRGPRVTITFATAEGLEANKTTIEYKSVAIGMIKRIDLLTDRSGVVVTAELSRQAEELLVDDARFWVVRPRVSMAGVSGIGTLLTGAHVGFDAGVSVKARRDFVGLEAPPTTISDRRGRRFTLRAESIGSLDVGSPLYLRRFQVGQVTRLALDADGDAAVLEIFVDAPYDRHVMADTRFWNASGVDLTLDARGIQLDTQSLASVLTGGIAFENPPDATFAPAAVPGTKFTLFPGRKAALRHPSSTANTYQLVFKHPVRGLTAGSSVELLGQEVGEVIEVDVDLDPSAASFRTIITVGIHPDRLNDGRSTMLLDRLVPRGLRAQVRTENMLTGRRYIALDFVPGARGVSLNRRRQPVELPTIEGGADDLPTAVTHLVQKLNRVPVSDLAEQGLLAVQEMRRTLEGTSRLVNRVDTQLAPQVGAFMGQASATMGTFQRTLTSFGSGARPVQQDMRTALRDLSGAGQALRSLAEYLERHPESLIRGKKEDRP
jgi:paraquat-inducible protein B